MVSSAPTTFAEQSHPERAADMVDEIRALAANIQAWQAAQVPTLSNEGLIKRFKDLGSSRTYKRILDNDLGRTKVEQLLPQYRRVWAAIRSIAAMDDEELYEDLGPALEVGEAVARVAGRHDSRRLVIIEGPSGSGKSKSLLLTARKFEGTVALVEANETWKSPRTVLGDLLLGTGAAMDASELPSSGTDRLKALVAWLNSKRMIVAIDEGHHITAAGLNLIKTLINKTDSVFVLAAIDTIWRKLTAANWEEVRQLVHNRLSGRVRLVPPTATDVELFLGRRVKFAAGGKWKKLSAKIASGATRFGHYAFLRNIAEDLLELADRPTADDLAEALDRNSGQVRTAAKQ